MKLSAKERQRRESILQREFANTTLPHALVLETMASLRDMPTASFLEPIGSKFTSEEKQQMYDIIATSPFLQKQSEIVRAWVQLRWQDVMERGHIPSPVEFCYIGEIFGKELEGTLFIKAMEVLNDLDSETRYCVTSPKNEIEGIIFASFKGNAHENGA